MKNIRQSYLGILAAAVGLLVGEAQAATHTWTNTAGGNWTSTGNWSPAANPNSSADTADFSTLNLPGNVTVNVDATRSIGHLKFGDQDGTPNNWTLTNNIITLGTAGGQGTITVLNGTATINNRINSAPPAGLTNIVKLGEGTLRFGYTAGQNNYGTKGLIIQEGTVAYAVNIANPFAQAVVFDGGTLAYGFGANGLQQGGTFTVASGGGTLRLTGGTADYRFATANQLRGSGTLVVNGGGTFWINADQSNFTGTLDLQDSGTTLKMGVTGGADMTGGSVALGSGTDLQVVGGFSASIARLTGTGSVFPASGTATLEVGDDGATPFTHAGTMSGGLSLRKIGTSQMIRSGDSTYTGTTTVDGGRLTVNGSHTTAGNYIINVDGILSGTGTISGASANMTIDGGTLEAGNSIGILTVPDLVLTNSAHVIFEIAGATTPGVDFDQIKGNAGDTLNHAGPWILDVDFQADIAGSQTIKIFNFAGYSGANDPTINIVGGAADSVSYDRTTGELTFSNAVIPEPATAIMLLLGGLALALRRTSAIG